MPANTTHGFPYPLGTDPISDGDDAIKNLAQALEKPSATPLTLNASLWVAHGAPHLAPSYFRIGPVAYLMGNFTNVAAGSFGLSEALLAPLPAAIKPANHVQAAVAFNPANVGWGVATLLFDVTRNNIYLNPGVASGSIGANVMNVSVNCAFLVA